MSRKGAFPGEAHAHGCTRCRTRYEDICSEPASNALCGHCRGGKPNQILIDNRLPKDCCRLSSRLAVKEEIVIYHLGGTSPWYICRVCARTQVYDPTVKRD